MFLFLSSKGIKIWEGGWPAISWESQTRLFTLFPFNLWLCLLGNSTLNFSISWKGSQIQSFTTGVPITSANQEYIPSPEESADIHCSSFRWPSCAFSNLLTLNVLPPLFFISLSCSLVWPFIQSCMLQVVTFFRVEGLLFKTNCLSQQ